MAANWIIQNAMQLWAACKNPDRDGGFPHLTMNYIFTFNWKWEPWHLVMRNRLFKDCACVCETETETEALCVCPWESDCCLAWPPVPSSRKLWNQKLSGSPSWSNSAWYVSLSCNCLFIGPLSKAIFWKFLQSCRLWKEGIIVQVIINGRMSKW